MQQNFDKNIENEKFYKIGEFAQMLRLNVQTLRIYDREGLLCPKRTAGNQRGYLENDLERAKVILYLTRALSVNLNGVKIILNFLEKGRLKPELALSLLKDIRKTVGITDAEVSNNLKRYNKEDLDIFET